MNTPWERLLFHIRADNAPAAVDDIADYLRESHPELTWLADKLEGAWDESWG